MTPLYARVSDQGADAVVEKAVQAALNAGIAESGDTVVVLCGMMTELEGANTTNMLKVHVAAEALTTGRVVVEGRATGPVVRTTDGDLSDVPEGALITLSSEFDEEFSGDLSRIGGIVSAQRGMTGYPALVAREMDIPMISGADVDDIGADDTVTIELSAESSTAATLVSEQSSLEQISSNHAQRSLGPRLFDAGPLRVDMADDAPDEAIRTRDLESHLSRTTRSGMRRARGSSALTPMMSARALPTPLSNVTLHPNRTVSRLISRLMQTTSPVTPTRTTTHTHQSPVQRRSSLATPTSRTRCSSSSARSRCCS